jgi:hypothetical protein
MYVDGFINEVHGLKVLSVISNICRFPDNPTRRMSGLRDLTAKPVPSVFRHQSRLGRLKAARPTLAGGKRRQ